MIREEYNFEDIRQYLLEHIDLLIVGMETSEERSHFFSKLWRENNKEVLTLGRIVEGKIKCSFWHSNGSKNEKTISLYKGLPGLLKENMVEDKNVLIDISSLDHVSIMALTKFLIQKVKPKSLFASYIRPAQYKRESGSVGFSLCDSLGAVSAVPCFAKYANDDVKQKTLCCFMGFEGVRINNIIEAAHNVDRFIPIFAFPSGGPQWYNVTMWNSMNVMFNGVANYSIRKCLSDSIFDAVDLLLTTIDQDEHLTLAPLGTRPHSMACAIFACQHKNTRIIYDYAEESPNRALGISNIMIYHLSKFLQV